MPQTNLAGPYLLAHPIINNEFGQIAGGVYALGTTNSRGAFRAQYIGRADFDLNEQLNDWVGSYQYFEAEFVPDAQAAFEEECQLYHKFGGNELLDNKIHPICTEHGWRCPIPECPYNETAQ
ncbi:MAG: hypothetical protein KGJ93_05475 [Patescibacteria group bacterium]|nr:hypothetical protein [Patescibacteria group bacterium]